MEKDMTPATRQLQLVGYLRCFQPRLAEDAQAWNRREKNAPLRSDPGAFVWVGPSAFAKTDRALVEAMELLALLAYVDWPAWKKFVRELWPPRLLDWVDEYDVRPHKIGVDMGGHCSDDVFEMLATDCDDPRSSVAYRTAKRVFLSELASLGRSIDEIPVEVDLGYLRAVGDEAKITQALDRQRDRRLQRIEGVTRSQATKPRYAGLYVRYVFARTEEPSGLVLAAVAAAAGATIHHVSSKDLKFVQHHPRDYMGVMKELLPDFVSFLGSHPRGISSLNLCMNEHTEVFPSVLSAIAASDCVRSINFIKQEFCSRRKRVYSTEERVELCQLWSWMVYGLFMKPFGGREHRIQRIDIDTSTLEQFTVDAVTRVLRAPNPVALLYGHQSSNEPPEVVSASRFALGDPTTAIGSEDKLTWSCGELLKNLPVIVRTHDWVSVLLPRWGKAWVHRDDVVEAHRVDATTIQTHSIPHVTLLNVDATSAHHVAALLRLIGPGIRSLDIDPRIDDATWREGPSHFENLCRHILTTCPVLETLQIGCITVAHANFQPLLDAYSSGTCRLQELELTRFNCVDADETFKQLIDALADRQHPARRNLRKLTISYVPVKITMDPVVVSSCVAMLGQNDRLHTLEVRWDRDDESILGTRGWDKDFQVVWDQFRGRQIAVRWDPCPKFAFLSVVTPQSDSEDELPAIQRLDTLVVSLILQFAAPSRARRVIFSKD